VAVEFSAGVVNGELPGDGAARLKAALHAGLNVTV